MKVKNCNSTISGQYTVVRDCEDGFWFYGSYEEFDRAQSVAKEIGNGVVVPTEEIERV